MGLSELGLTFFKVGGHTHDGVNSSKIDLTNYAESDLAYINALIRRAIGQAGGFGNFPEGISIGIGSADGATGSGSVFVGGYTPPPTGLTLSTGVSQIEREVVYIDAIWSPPDPLTVPSGNQSVEYEVTLKKTGDTAMRISRTKTPQIRFSPVDPGTSYTVTVRGVNGLNVPSTVLTTSPITSAVDSVAPAVPGTTGASPFFTASGGLKTVTVSWNENPETDVAKGRGFYDVQIALSSASFVAATGLTPTVQTQRVNATVATFAGLDSFVSYKVTVRAVDSSGNASNYATAVAVSTGGLAPTDSDGTSSIPWEQTWEQFSIADWDIRSGSSGDFARVTGQGSHGGNVLRASNTGVKWLSWKYNFAYDPNKTYKVSFRIRANTSTLANVYLGVFGIAADGTTLVDTAGGTSVNAQYAFAANNQSIAAGSAWTTYTGYIRGVSASPPGGSFADPNNPGPMHTNAKYFRPFIEATNAASATYDIDSISVEEVGFVVGSQNLGTSSVIASKVGFTMGGGNIVTNSNFGVDMTGWSVVQGGGTQTPTVARVTDTTTPISAYGTAMEWTMAADSGKTFNLILGPPTGSFVKSGQTYTVSFYGKLVSGDGAWQLRFLNTNGLNGVGFPTQSFTLTSTWTRFVYTFTAANDGFADTRWYLPRQSINNAGVSRFTGFQFELGDVATSYAPKPDEILPGTILNPYLAPNAVTYDKMSVGIGGGNMLGNSSWENDDGLWVGGSAPITRTLDTTEHFHGAKSAKAVVAATSGQVISYFNQFIRGVGGTTLPHAPLVGQKITMSIWVKITAITGGSLSAQWEIWNSAESASLASISLFAIGAVTSGWQRFSATMTVPTNGDHSRILIQQFNGAGTSSSTYYLDAWQLEVGDLATAYSPAPEEILPGTIGTTEIADNAITTQKIIANAITANKIAANTITASQIAANTITASQIAADTITANEIAANAITVNELAANSVNASKIVANTITAAQIAANTITGDRIVAGTITAEYLAIGTFGPTMLPNGGFEDVSQFNANIPAKWVQDVATNGSISLTTTAAEVKGGTRALRIANTTNTANVFVTSDYFPVEAAKIYAHEMWYQVPSGSATLTVGIYYEVYFYDRAQSFLSSQNPLNNAGGVAGTWNLFQGTTTAPANACYARIRIGVNNPDQTTSAVDFDEVKVNEQVSGTRISDGAITTNKMTANTINGDRISAGTLAANKIIAGDITATQIAANAITSDKLLVTVGGTNNLLNNSSFENIDPGTSSNVSRWRNYPAGGALTRSNAVAAFQGSWHSASTNATGSAATIGCSPFLIPIFANATYTWSIYMRAATTIRSCSAQINWYDADNNFISSSNGTAANNATGSWTRFVVTGTAPANAYKCVPYALVAAAANGETHYYDAAQLELSGSASAWIINPIELAPGTIMSDNIVAGTITGDRIAAQSITSGDNIFGTAAIQSADINTLTATKLTAGTITGQNIIVGGNTKSTTIASGSNGVVLSGSVPTINVASTTDFPNSGVVSIYNGSTFIGNISYTSKNSTQFLGCAPSGSSATLLTGMTVSGPNATTGAGVINSANYAPGTAGWYIDQAGNVEFNNAVFRGSVYGSYVTGSTITGGKIRTSVSGPRVELDSTSVSAGIDFRSGLAIGNSSGQEITAAWIALTGYSPARPNVEIHAGTSNTSQKSAFLQLVGAEATDNKATAWLHSDDYMILTCNDSAGIEMGATYFSTNNTKVKIGLNSYSLEVLNGSLQMGTNSIIGSYAGQAPAINARSGNAFTVDWSNPTLTLYIDSTAIATFHTGSGLTGSSTKTFVINHPTDIAKYLVHATVEGPTNDVVYRGKNKVGSGGIVYIKVPEYFESLTHEDNRTVQLTAKGSGENYPKNLRATDVIAGGFYVEADTPGQFDWEVTAERKDVPKLEVEPRKADYVLSGDGPYTYLEKRMGGIIN